LGRREERVGWAGLQGEREWNEDVLWFKLFACFLKTLAQAKTNTIKIKATLGVILFNLENK
jgi:hypothetical protein